VWKVRPWFSASVMNLGLILAVTCMNCCYGLGPIWSDCHRAAQKASLFTWSDPLNVECRMLKDTGSIVKVTVLTGTVMYVYYIFQPPVSSGATLIVAPHSITHQWVDEVLRHVAVDALQIFVSSLYLLNLLMARYDHCNCHVM